MTTARTITRQRIEAQGFVGYDDATLAQINYPLRLAPALCMSWLALGTYLASPLMLWALMPFAALGAVLRGHPFDVIYNYGIRHVIKTSELPRYATPRRFGCVLMTIWLAVNGFAFYAGATTLGYALGTIGVIAPLINVVTGFCVPSYIYGLLFGKPKHADEQLKHAV